MTTSLYQMRGKTPIGSHQRKKCNGWVTLNYKRIDAVISHSCSEPIRRINCSLVEGQFTSDIFFVRITAFLETQHVQLATMICNNTTRQNPKDLVSALWVHEQPTIMMNVYSFSVLSIFMCSQDSPSMDDDIPGICWLDYKKYHKSNDVD